MKKIIAIFLLTSTLISCDDKNDTVDVLIGKWIPQTIIINGESIAYTGHTNCGQDFIHLNNYNTFEIVNYIDLSVTDVDCPFEKYYGSYTLLNNELKLQGSNFFQGGLIIEKTSNILKLQRNIDVDGDGKQDEVVEVFTR